MIYPSIDKILSQIDSKYSLVNIVAKRAREMRKTGHYQIKEKGYTTKKPLSRALEEVSMNMIHTAEILES